MKNRVQSTGHTHYIARGDKQGRSYTAVTYVVYTPFYIATVNDLTVPLLLKSSVP